MDELLLQTYCNAKPDSATFFRFSANRIYFDFLWSLWGKTRVPYDGEVMEAYVFNRYMQPKTTMAKSSLVVESHR